MTLEEAARIAAMLISARHGRISDDGGRPWLYVNVRTRGDAEKLREALGRGCAKERRDRHGGRYGAWGNDALEVYEYLLEAGLSGGRAVIARMFLQRYGNDGKPWASELERLCAAPTDASAKGVRKVARKNKNGAIRDAERSAGCGAR